MFPNRQKGFFLFCHLMLLSYLCYDYGNYLYYYCRSYMKKFNLDLEVTAVERLSPTHVVLKLTHRDTLPAMVPGQFVEVRVDHSPSTFLRRPISVNFVDVARNELWLLVAGIGDGTRTLCNLSPGAVLNCVFPLGNGFTKPTSAGARVLLVGGGVGVAPLLFFGKQLQEAGHEVTFLLGARSAKDLLQLELFGRYGRVCVTTEDGTMGEQGFVTAHSILQRERFDQISTCGPKPMMVSVARYAMERDIFCEASLENLMACGVGACLCCVEKTVAGNLCVCKEGPVFNVKDLLWQA